MDPAIKFAAIVVAIGCGALLCAIWYAIVREDNGC